MRTYEWFSPHGHPVTFGPGGHKVLRAEGFGSTRTSLQSRKSPGQSGVSAIDRTVGPRVVSLQVDVRAADVEALHVELDRLARACAGTPGVGEPPAFGRLRVHRPGLPTVETRAEPEDSPREVARINPRMVRLDFEWTCPSPLWFEVAEQNVVFELAEDPWTSPWDAPWFSPAAANEHDVESASHVPVGFRVRFWGPQTAMRLTNLTTGETLQVFGQVPAGEFAEVDTEERTVTQGGVSILNRWDFNGSWWTLRPGSNRVRWEATTATADSRTVLLWRNALAGV